MGRPKIDIKPEKVEALASYGCTNTEIAAFFGCDPSQITRRFAKEVTKGKETCKIRLRKKQMEVAMHGNVTMLIWLGKQMLGQAEKYDIDIPPAYVLPPWALPKKKKIKVKTKEKAKE